MKPLSIPALRAHLIRVILAPIVTFIVSFILLFGFFLSTTETWGEPLIAAFVFAMALGFFAFLTALAPRSALGAFLVLLTGFFLIYTMAGGEYYGACPVSTYCLRPETFGTIPFLLITISAKVIGLIDVIVFGILLYRTLLTLLRMVPQARYYLGAGIFFFFVLLFFAVYQVLDYEPRLFQKILMGFYALMGTSSLLMGLQYHKKFNEKWKRLFAALFASSIFLLPLLVPWEPTDTSDPQDVALGYAFFIGFAILAFFGLLFSKKKKTLEQH